MSGFKILFISLPILNNMTPKNRERRDLLILFLIILHFLKRKGIEDDGLNKS